MFTPELRSPLPAAGKTIKAGSFVHLVLKWRKFNALGIIQAGCTNVNDLTAWRQTL
jgi:hypothetical protein